MDRSPNSTAGSPLARLLYPLFFLSGFSGLVYEVIWMRRFAVVFGNTTHAITVVLAAFMAGLAAGSFLFGRIADRPGRRASLLSYYGWMEVMIGLYCLGFDTLLSAEKAVIFRFYTQFDPGPGASLAFKFGLSMLGLVVPTLLMGGTLPVLIKALSHRLPEVGRITGRLYFVNCFGAVFGTLAVAFWMIPHLGLPLSTAAAAGINILVGITALGLRSRLTEAFPEADSRSQEVPATLEGPTGEGWLEQYIYFGIFICGFTAMVYEIAWTRVLSLVLGSSTYSFAVMLAAFITGIALGSLAASRWMERIRRPVLAFAVTQVAVGVAVALSMPLYSRLPLFFIRCRELVNFDYETHEAFKYIVCLLVTIVPTLAIGMGFPLLSRAASRKIGKVAGQVGGVYAVNTLGNILGSVLCGLVLIPVLGIKYTICLALVFNLLSVAVIFQSRGLGSWPRYAALATVILVLSLAGTADWDRHLLTAGVFRYRPGESASIENYERNAREREFLFYKEGLSTTVTVERVSEALMLRVNGKVDASNLRDMRTQYLLAHLPMLLHPLPEKVLVIGAGSGATCGAALSHPELKRLVCVEIAPEVVEGSRFFAEVNHRYWEDARTEIAVDDGRNYLFRNREKWDVIASEPSNPWIAGIGSLYTEEFYADCRERLAPGGIICQWIHLYEMQESVLKTILITFMKYFPATVAFTSVEGNDLLLIGSEAELQPDLDLFARRMRSGQVAADLRRIGITSPFTLLTTQVLDRTEMRRWAGVGPTNTDDFPSVEYQAPRGFFYATQAEIPAGYRIAGSNLLGRYLATHQVTAAELVELARFQSASGMTNLVYSALADALEREPGHREALEFLAELLIDRKKYREAEEVIARLAAAGADEKKLLELEYPVATAQAERRSASFLTATDFSRSIAINQRLAELEPGRSL
ncbi:MAG: fused MFS/spermidine synthase, partial [Candidatus Glassbacteria bacterium]